MLRTKPWVAMVSCSLLAVEGHPADIERAGPSITSTLSEVTQQTGIPGITFAIHGSHLERSYSAGFADRERRAKMRPDAVMMGGSTGKVFLAVVAYQDIARGRLHYDDKVAHYLGGTAGYDSLPGAADFTVAMLLAHSTGLVDGAVDAVAFANPRGEWTHERRFKAAAGTQLLFPSGTAFGYSDLNYQILAAVIESIEGEHFEDLVSSRILRPLRMLGTRPATSPYVSGLASGYAGPTTKPQYENLRPPDKTAQSGQLFLNPAFEGGGGGFSTRSPDLAKFMYALFNARLLGQQELQRMVSPPEPVPGYSGKGSYGAGLFTFPTALGPAHGHGGIWFGYKTLMLYYPSLCIGAALQVNSQIDGEGNDLRVYRLGERRFDSIDLLTELVRQAFEQEGTMAGTAPCQK